VQQPPPLNHCFKPGPCFKRKKTALKKDCSSLDATFNLLAYNIENLTANAVFKYPNYILRRLRADLIKIGQSYQSIIQKPF